MRLTVRNQQRIARLQRIDGAGSGANQQRAAANKVQLRLARRVIILQAKRRMPISSSLVKSS
ncbi:hypothetical protein E05_00270 [Plautia stali symbiont]|nr:hypothetical protein E05_00270 [Plautia stali symbiont]